MTKRLRPISNLYFKFIQGTVLEGILDDVDVARCLSELELIEMTYNERGDVRYSELQKLHKQGSEAILECLKGYAIKHSPMGSVLKGSK